MKLTYPRVKVALTIAALAVAAWGCAGNDAAAYIQSAKSYIAKADYKAAIIELTNAAQISPENAEARYLLGKALLESGDPSGAETELRKAIAQHADDDLTFPLLAQALIGQGE